MKVKQHTLKGFEFELDDTQAFIDYFSKNAPLMQGHLIMLKGKVDDALKAFLESRDLAYVQTDEKPLMTRKKRSTHTLEVAQSKTSTVDEKSDANTLCNHQVFHRPIRSGEEISSESGMSFFGRINSGAVIDSTACLEFFATIDGLVRAEGSHILLRDIGKGNVFFHGEELDKTLFQGQLTLVEYKDGLVMKTV